MYENGYFQYLVFFLHQKLDCFTLFIYCLYYLALKNQIILTYVHIMQV